MNRLLISIIGLLSFCVAKADNLGYSPDGGLVSFGEFDYIYDSASRLTEVWSNGKSWIKATLNDSAKFNPGWGDAEIKGLIEEAFAKAKAQGKIKPSQLDGFVYDTGRTVGAANGNLTTKIKIHVGRDGKNLHAFPWP